MTGSVTELLNSMRDGVDHSMDQLLKRFLPMLRNKLSSLARDLRISDEDDVAVAAFYDLCTAINNSRFQDISDRTQLWQVLSMIAVRKANDFRKSENAQRRGGGLKQVTLNSVRQEVVSSEPAPDLNLEMLEQCQLFLESLEDDRLKEIAKRKLHGLTNQEVADELGISRRTVQYMLARIKEKMLEAWSEFEVQRKVA